MMKQFGAKIWKVRLDTLCQFWQRDRVKDIRCISMRISVAKKRTKSCQHISVFRARALLYIVAQGKPGSKSQKGGNLIFFTLSCKEGLGRWSDIYQLHVCVESYNFIRPIWQLFIELLRHGFDSGARIEISLVFHSFGCAPSFRVVSFWISLLGNTKE